MSPYVSSLIEPLERKSRSVSVLWYSPPNERSVVFLFLWFCHIKIVALFSFGCSFHVSHTPRGINTRDYWRTGIRPAQFSFRATSPPDQLLCFTPPFTSISNHQVDRATRQCVEAIHNLPPPPSARLTQPRQRPPSRIALFSSNCNHTSPWSLAPPPPLPPRHHPMTTTTTTMIPFPPPRTTTPVRRSRTVSDPLSPFPQSLST